MAYLSVRYGSGADARDRHIVPVIIPGGGNAEVGEVVLHVGRRLWNVANKLLNTCTVGAGGVKALLQDKI